MNPVDDRRPFTLRHEMAGDEDPIAALTERAFEPMPFADGTEAAIVDRLRTDGDLTLSLVAEMDGRIVGHVAFSPVTIDGTSDGWFGLGPISVEPSFQKRGIGRALIEAGLAKLRSLGASGCVLIGSPALYGRFGFLSGPLTYGAFDRRDVQYHRFGDQTPAGELRFAPAFDLEKHP